MSDVFLLGLNEERFDLAEREEPIKVEGPVYIGCDFGQWEDRIVCTLIAISDTNQPLIIDSVYGNVPQPVAPIMKKRNDTKKAKGYQPPPWVTRRRRSR